MIRQLFRDSEKVALLCFGLMLFMTYDCASKGQWGWALFSSVFAFVNLWQALPPWARRRIKR